MSVPADRPPHLPDLKRHSWRAVRALLAVAVAFACVVPQASAAAAMSRVSAAGPGEHDTAPTWVGNSRLAFQRRIPGSISCNVATLHTIDTDGTGDLAGPSFYPWPYKFLPGTGRVAYIPNSPACAGPFPTYYQVVTSELDGSDVQTAAAPPSSNNILYLLAVSPDGSKIAFVNEDAPGQQPSLYVVGSDGTGLTRVGISPGWASFSPDGSKIAFTTGSGVEVANTDASASRQIAANQDGQVAWSPDGGVIAVAGAGLVFLDPDATDPSCPRGGCPPPTGNPPRTISTEFVSDPTWSSDGSRLAVKRSVYVPGGQDTEEIAVVSRSGDGFHDVTSTGGFVTGAPAWSPDGGTLAFASFHESTLKSADPGFESFGSTSIYTVDVPAAPVTDADGDGIPDAIDPDPFVASNAFSDGAGTSGTITDRAGLTVQIADEPAPDGVRVTVGPGTGRVTLSVCGFTLRVSAGGEVVVTCGSVKVRVVEGDAEVVLGGGLTIVSVPSGATAKVSENPDGSFKVETLSGGPVTVTVDGVATTLAAGETRAVTALDFIGFSSPVDNPSILNVVKAGQSVPFKWRLLRANLSPYTTLAQASMRVTGLTCSLGGTADQLEEVATGASGLQNLGNGNYQINWKAPKEYAGSCKVLHLDLGEGVTRDAYFKFVK